MTHAQRRRSAARLKSGCSTLTGYQIRTQRLRVDGCAAAAIGRSVKSTTGQDTEVVHYALLAKPVRCGGWKL